MLLVDYCPVEKKDGKKDLIQSIGHSGFEMVFTFLVETIAI